MLSTRKIEAVYDLRAAAETKVRAEVALEQQPSPDRRAALLDASLELEARTQDAIEVCHECGQEHAPGAGHHAADTGDNVVNVDFRIDAGAGEDQDRT
jgi:hypothetical protein